MDNKHLTLALLNTTEKNITEFKNNIQHIVSDKLKSKISTAIKETEKTLFIK